MFLVTARWTRVKGILRKIVASRKDFAVALWRVPLSRLVARIWLASFQPVISAMATNFGAHEALFPKITLKKVEREGRAEGQR